MTPHASGRVRFTRGKDDTAYAIYLAEDESSELPRAIEVRGVRPAAGARVTLLGSDARILWEPAADGFVLRLPAGVRAPAAHAWTFRISVVER
jgi:alpha-L-fucosidase